MKIQSLGTFLVLTFVAPLLITAQTTNSPAKPIPPAALAPLPENPDSAMALARQMNGLDESGTKSWHIRAKYEIYDTDDGKAVSGIYEETWAGPKKYRRGYTGSKFTQTDYASANGLYRSGDQEWPKGTLGMLRRLLVQPFSYIGSNPQTSLLRVKRNFSQTDFVCLVQKPSAKGPIQVGGVAAVESYHQNCFEADKPILRMALRLEDNRQGVIWNNVVFFQGRFVARDIKFMQAGKLRLAIHVELIEEAPTKSDEMFTPLAGANGPIAGRIQGDSSMTHVLYAAPPVYPDLAKAHHVEGKVTMQITVGKDGLVTDVKVINGPALLQDAAVEAARKWRFEPVLVMGAPVEMDMPLEIGFKFGS